MSYSLLLVLYAIRYSARMIYDKLLENDGRKKLADALCETWKQLQLHIYICHGKNFITPAKSFWTLWNRNRN